MGITAKNHTGYRRILGWLLCLPLLTNAQLDDSLDTDQSYNPLTSTAKDDALENLVDSVVWTASWIGTEQKTDTVNSWAVFRKILDLKEDPTEKVIAKMAVDSKYWLGINGEMAVFEGGLKRGPTPENTYYDEVDVGSFLKKGKNSIAVLIWYFGKHGFSHKSSGKPGFLFDVQANGIQMASDATWKA
jgi:hypothetical protein